MASRYSRYDADRRSRSPRDRSAERFDRASHYSDGDRRRSSTEVRMNSSAFPPNRDGFGDQLRREPPRGPKALIDPPSGPRGGGFAGDFRGRGRGRGGRPWPSRDDSRDRGRDRDIDYRDRYRDERSRERDRDRDRDRDWRDRGDFRSRRSPIGRARSPTRDFRDRDRDIPPGPDTDRSRRGSRDGGPPSAGSSSSEPPYGMAPFPRGGGFARGRGRGGRGDWPADRGRGRVPYDDRPDRYRSRSQEGRWIREREDRDRGDRYDGDMRRDPRDERDRGGERELFRSKMEARAAAQDSAPPAKEISPPPVAPSAPAFGSVPNRVPSTGDAPAAVGGTGKAPPTAPKAFGERPVSAGHASTTTETPTGPAKSTIHDSPPIPIGPRAQQQKQQRPSSKQWINPNLKKGPDSPKMNRSPSFVQHRTAPFQRDSSQIDQPDLRRPRSSDAKSDSHIPGLENRMRSHHSAEPGEITSRPEDEQLSKETANYRRGSIDHGLKLTHQRKESLGSNAASLRMESIPKFANSQPAEESKTPIKPIPKRKRKCPKISVVRFALPPKTAQQGEPSESDDEDMGDFFAMEIDKTEAELSKLQKPKLPLEVMARFMALSHGSMVQIMNDPEGLSEMLGDALPAGSMPIEAVDSEPIATKPEIAQPSEVSVTSQPIEDIQGPVVETVEQMPTEVEKADTVVEIAPEETQPKAEEMDVDHEQEQPAPELETRLEPTIQNTIEKPDLKSVEEQRPEPAPVFTEAPLTQLEQPPVAVETIEPGSKPPSTPSQVEDDETESEDDTYMDMGAAREFMTTPPVDSLPDYAGQVWYNDKEFVASLDFDPIIDEFVAEHLQKMHIEKKTEQHGEQRRYAENYIHYLNFTMSSDPVAVKSRDKFSVATPADIIATAAPEPKPEGRGTGRRFATERDLERVLEASMREDEQRRERELRIQQEKYRSDKEAVIPNMYWDEDDKQKEQYIDRTGYTPPDMLVAAWQILPPVNNFTEEESQLFEKRYLEHPKQWGKIAEVIPHRDFRTCIHYYYMMKKELNLKDKLKRQPKRRKKGGRGKQRSSALVSELGNGEPEGEENQDNGENGERRRPRRAAAPTWGFEQPPTDGESTPAGTPGRRGASAAARGDQPEKVDGRKGRRKAKDKDKEKEKDKDKDKATKSSQALTAAPTNASAKGRGRADSRPVTADFQTVPPDPQRLAAQFEQPLPPSIQPPPFAVQQPQPIQAIERPKAAPVTSIAEVMAAPSLRPEPLPPPQSSMTTFNLAQPTPERKAPTQASSYWSVSEANDFPHLLRAFGSDWAAIATHMGSKTAVMVKNYFVRQKDQGKSDWETFVQEAEAKRSRGEKRPEPPVPTTGGRGRRYDTTTPSTSRPLAVAPGADAHVEASQAKGDAAAAAAAAQASRAQPFSGYGVPIAQAPVQSLAQPGQPPLAMQSHTVPQPAQQAMSPSMRSLRPPLPPFGFPERERESAQPQRVPLPQKAPSSQVPELRDPRPLAAAQPLQSAHSEAIAEHERNAQIERMNVEKRLRDQHQREQQQRDQHQREQHQLVERERERDRERDRDREREREREMARQAEQQAMRVKQEVEGPPPQHHYEPYGHRQQLSHGGGAREPFSLTRPSSQEPSRSAIAQAYPTPVQQQAPQPMRALLSDPSAAQSPTVVPLRQIQTPQPRQSSGPAHDPYGAPPPQSASSMPPLTPARPAEQPRKSNIMSLLNDDPPPPKRVSEVSGNHPPGPSSTPPGQGIGRPPPGPPPVQIRREPEPQYSPFSRTPSSGPSAMPSLKPTYPASPAPSQHVSGHRSMPSDPAIDRDYYRSHGYPQNHPASGTNSPQAAHRYPPPAQTSQPQYPAQTGYPTSYGASQASHAASPPAQYAVHSSSRSREVPQNTRENAWPSSSHQPTPSSLQQPGSGWPTTQPKSTQAPPPNAQQAWGGQHPSTTAKPSTPAPAWSSAPPPPQHHMPLRDDRGPPSMYGSSSQSIAQQQHSLSSRYPPVTRAPEPIPPQTQQYPRYASTPGPPPPRDPREQIPSRSYTPGIYDARGAPPPPPPPGQPQGAGYPAPDPREMQLRDARDPRDPRDPRDIMTRGLRPHEYDRHPDSRYGR